ncbi:hypothetical protein BCR35DRAFT_302738 [Leucosporidium creatinivorum]|uniref:F-box domain-containing protein n=1 Tax=Leucosporidium creatinivorum TaxID=106004 RepID=A0A1Y2FMU6_9BASI|nr:hypothetical protein BCR35DRAFT_302738 [Leucosporidium creatinivorum]
MSSRESSPAPITSFRLLDLPTELIERICLFVAVQRYEYAYSRRPIISPLKALAGSSKLLNELASPLLHRRATYDRHRLHCGPNERCCKQLRNLSYALFIQSAEIDLPSWRPDIHEQLTTLELRGGSRPPRMSSTSLTTLLVRRMYAQVPELDLPNLHNVVASQVHQTWLEQLAALPSVRRFNVTVAQSAQVSCDLKVSAWCGDLFEKVQDFVLEVPPSRQLDTRTPLEMVLEDLKVLPSAPLRSLTLNVRLQLHQAPSRLGFARFLNALKSFEGVPLDSLSLDDYILVQPSDLEALAEAFPSLTKLAFGDRTVWAGSKEDHLSALSHFPQLTSLECPRWADAVEEWTEPDELVREVGASLKRLEVLGLSGQQSEASWWRLGRDQRGGSLQVDGVTFYSLDLDRPCY